MDEILILIPTSRNKLAARILNAISAHNLQGQEESLVLRMLSATKAHVGDAIDSKDIDPLMASLANSLDSVSSSYSILATRLELSSIYREAETSFSSAMETAKLYGRISGRFMDLVNRNRKTLNSMIEFDRDNYFTYSALRSLREKYLIQKGCVLVERPQYLWLRVALQMHLSDMEGVKIAYDLMSCLKYIQTPQYSPRVAQPPQG
ncbi:hypothetical protein D9611_011599 [Ephemerocybe angulata]|uniref:Ribonucleotide reductase large subunit N-terminal domain-containing protein n=1 Tax=Ephemerocybe angulata TaxID=980116 RepID=A0A8H5ET39_9AGAR|nr:hypothetical protein D9611_011599 [Tulosesus angulatus]